MPLPSLSKAAPVSTSARLVLPAPPKLSRLAPAASGWPLASVRLPASLLMRTAPFSVMAAVTVLLPLLLRSAPVAAAPTPLPVPANVTGSARVMPPASASEAPAATLVPAATPPSALACRACSTPSSTLMLPL